MCGIGGFYLSASSNGRHHNINCVEVISKMVGSLHHRGPDDRDTWIDEKNGTKIGFGHTRLSILDLSSAGRQPMVDPQTGNRILYNGEVYNFRELHQSLNIDESVWSSSTDTEVVLRAYAKWGKQCLEHLRGMFAFAIWDEQQQVLFLARDRLGIKPLYYYVSDGLFVFSSEVRTLLASGLVPRLLDPVALEEYLAYQSIPAPHTLIRGLRTMLPGTWMTVNASGKIQEGSYWDLLANTSLEARFATKAESHHKVGELLRESMALHLVSDVPVGAFLSGGIDSTIITALMTEAGKTPQTFTVVFTEKAYTEARHAGQVASKLHTDHTEILLTEQTLLEQLPVALAAMDQPTGDGVNTYVVSQYVKKAGIKVALSGLGGDEFFAGYPSFARFERAGKYLRMWGKTPHALRSLAARAVRAIGGSSLGVAKSASIIESDGTIPNVYPWLRQVLLPAQRRALFSEPWQRITGVTPDPYVALLREAFIRAPDAEMLSQVSYAEARTYMHDVLLRDTDQMSMAHSLEVRVPLLDHKLVEYVMGLPDARKRPNGTFKRLLVESVSDLVPREVAQRPKQGFTLPFDLWMKGALRQFCSERLSPKRIGGRGIMRPDEVQKLWQEYLSGSPKVSWSRLWVLVVLEEWLERNGVVCES